FGDKLNDPVAPAQRQFRDGPGFVAAGGGPIVVATEQAVEADPGLIKNMDPDDLRASYLRFIGAGAVAAGGIISMCRALPLIIGSIGAGLRDLRASWQAAATGTAVAVPRTERDMPMTVVLWGSLAFVVILAAVPAL